MAPSITPRFAHKSDTFYGDHATHARFRRRACRLDTSAALLSTVLVLRAAAVTTLIAHEAAFLRR